MIFHMLSFRDLLIQLVLIWMNEEKSNKFRLPSFSCIDITDFIFNLVWLIFPDEVKEPC